MKTVSLFDLEDSQYIRLKVDHALSGVELMVWNDDDESLTITIDAGLFKKFCQDSTKAINVRAVKKNHVGEVLTKEKHNEREGLQP